MVATLMCPACLREVVVPVKLVGWDVDAKEIPVCCGDRMVWVDTNEDFCMEVRDIPCQEGS